MDVTIKDIAQRAHVSVSTVSRVLNNKADVHEETKRRVQEIIEELGYSPNSIARGLVLQRTHTIGLLIPDITNPFFPEVARGVENRAKELGYSLIFCDSGNDMQSEKDAIALFRSKQVDGIILSLSLASQAELFRLQSEQFPVVQIDRGIPELRIPTVAVDNVLSAATATGYLIQLGHRRIAHITGDLGTKTGRDRLQGYRKALASAGIEPEESWIVEGAYDIESGAAGATRLLFGPHRPTAIFAANDLIAMGVYQVALDGGLRIPDDLSVVGHDDIQIAGIVRPGLTTMSQPKYKLGQVGVELLIKEIDSGESTAEEIVLLTELVTRGSAAPAG